MMITMMAMTMMVARGVRLVAAGGSMVLNLMTSKPATVNTKPLYFNTKFTFNHLNFAYFVAVIFFAKCKLFYLLSNPFNSPSISSFSGS